MKFCWKHHFQTYFKIYQLTSAVVWTIKCLWPPQQTERTVWFSSLRHVSLTRKSPSFVKRRTTSSRGRTPWNHSSSTSDRVDDILWNNSRAQINDYDRLIWKSRDKIILAPFYFTLQLLAVPVIFSLQEDETTFGGDQFSDAAVLRKNVMRTFGCCRISSQKILILEKSYEYFSFKFPDTLNQNTNKIIWKNRKENTSSKNWLM